MKSKKLFFIVALCFATNYYCMAQIVTRYLTEEDALKTQLEQFTQVEIQEKVLPEIDVKSLLKEDSIEADLGMPFRFGKDIPVDIDLTSDGTYIQQEDHFIILYKIKSKNATSINLIFDKFHLSKNSSLEIFNSDRTVLYGPVDYNNNPDNGILWTDVIPGESIIIKVKCPGKSREENQLHISSVTHGYRSFDKGYGSSQCGSPDIACPEGNNKRAQANSVCLLIMNNGTALCTGALVNTTSQNLRPFILTAFHCVDISLINGVLESNEKNAVSNWLFRFHYESPTCGGSDGITYKTFNGSYFISAFQRSDFALLELKKIPTDPDISYAGWKSTIYPGNVTSTYGIHHPKGDVKKISIDNNPIVDYPYSINWGNNIITPGNSHWKAVFDIGAPELGSSGSPLFDQNNRIVGQLHGGESGCTGVSKFYGRFDVSWNGGLTDATRLKNWLDPCNMATGTASTIPSVYISGASTLSIGATSTYTLNNVPSNATVAFSSSSNFGFVSSTSNSVTLRALTTGNGYVTAMIINNCGTTTLPNYNVLIPPSTPISITNFCCNGMGFRSELIYNFIVNYASNEGINKFEWIVNGGMIITGGNTNSITVLVSQAPPQGIPFDISVRVGNNYAWSPYHTRMGYAAPIVGPVKFNVSPNPAKTQVTISIADNKSGTSSYEDISNIKIVDSQGMTRKIADLKSSNESVSIDVSDLRKGVYIITIDNGKHKETHQLIIE